MRINKPNVPKANTGSAREGVFGNGRGAQRVGQVKSGHHFHAIPAGGSRPGFTGPHATGHPVQKTKPKKQMY